MPSRGAGRPRARLGAACHSPPILVASLSLFNSAVKFQQAYLASSLQEYPSLADQ